MSDYNNRNNINNINPNYSSFTDSNNEAHSAESNDSSYRNRKKKNRGNGKHKAAATVQNKSKSTKSIAIFDDVSKEKSSISISNNPEETATNNGKSISFIENSSEASHSHIISSKKRKYNYDYNKLTYPKPSCLKSKTNSLIRKHEHRDILGRIKTKKCFIRATSCSICLDKVHIRSRLNVCKHEFCKDCIFKWSEVSNECPNCKVEFDKIWYWPIERKHQRRMKMVKSRKFILPKEDTEQEQDNLIESGAENCLICTRSNDLHLLLLCDACNYNVCHTYCLGLDRIPEGNWFCPKCDRNKAVNNKAHNNINNNIINNNFNLINTVNKKNFNHSNTGNNNIKIDVNVNVNNNYDQNDMNNMNFIEDECLFSNQISSNNPCAKNSSVSQKKNNKNAKENISSEKKKNKSNLYEDDFDFKSYYDNYPEYFYDPNKKMTRGNRGNLDILISTINFDMSKKVINRPKRQKAKALEKNGIAQKSLLDNSISNNENSKINIDNNINNCSLMNCYSAVDNEESYDKNIYNDNEFFFDSNNFNYNNIKSDNENESVFNTNQVENKGIMGFDLDESAFKEMKTGEENEEEKSKFGFAAKNIKIANKQGKGHNLEKFNTQRAFKNKMNQLKQETISKMYSDYSKMYSNYYKTNENLH